MRQFEHTRRGMAVRLGVRRHRGESALLDHAGATLQDPPVVHVCAAFRHNDESVCDGRVAPTTVRYEQVEFFQT